MNRGKSERPQLNVIQWKVTKLDSSAHHTALCSTEPPTVYHVAQCTSVELHESEIVRIEPRAPLTTHVVNLVHNLGESVKDGTATHQTFQENEIPANGPSSNSLQSLNLVCSVHAPLISPNSSDSSDDAFDAANLSTGATHSRQQTDSMVTKMPSTNAHPNLPAMTSAHSCISMHKQVKVKTEKLDDVEIKVAQPNELSIKKEQLESCESFVSSTCATSQATSVTDDATCRISSSTSAVPRKNQPKNLAAPIEDLASRNKLIANRQPLANIPVTISRARIAEMVPIVSTQSHVTGSSQSTLFQGGKSPAPTNGVLLNRIKVKEEASMNPAQNAPSSTESKGSSEQSDQGKPKSSASSNLKTAHTVTSNDGVPSHVTPAPQVVKEENSNTLNSGNENVTKVSDSMKIVSKPEMQNVDLPNVAEKKHGNTETKTASGSLLCSQISSELNNRTPNITSEAGKKSNGGSPHITVQSSDARHVDVTTRCQSLTAKQYNRIFREFLIAPKDSTELDKCSVTNKETADLNAGLSMQLLKKCNLSDQKPGQQPAKQLNETEGHSPVHNDRQDTVQFFKETGGSSLDTPNEVHPPSGMKVVGDLVMGHATSAEMLPSEPVRKPPVKEIPLTAPVERSPRNQEKEQRTSTAGSDENCSSTSPDRTVDENSFFPMPDTSTTNGGSRSTSPSNGGGSAPVNAPDSTENEDSPVEDPAPPVVQRTKLLVRGRGRGRPKKSLGYLKRSTGKPVIDLSKTCHLSKPSKRKIREQTKLDTSERKQPKTPKLNEGRLRTKDDSAEIHRQNSDEQQGKPDTLIADDRIKPCFVNISRIDKDWMQSNLDKTEHR